jgi:two-component system cell cycle response regulator
MVGDRDKILKAGFDGYIPKPIFPETFVKQVEEFLAVEKVTGKLRLDSFQESISGLAPERKTATILAVDDSPLNLSLIHSTLEPSGYKVVSARSVQRALAEIKKRPFDLILSDLHMPEASGFDLLRRVRSAPEFQSIPFVLFSASSSGLADISGFAKEMGAHVFFTSPIEPEVLLSLIDSLLHKTAEE